MTPEHIVEVFRSAGMNLEPSPNALYTVRGQHAQLIEAARAIAAQARAEVIEECAARIQKQALEYVSLLDQCSDALHKVAGLEAQIENLKSERDEAERIFLQSVWQRRQVEAQLEVIAAKKETGDAQ